MNPYALLPLSGFLANVALAGAVFARSPHDRPNRVYALLCLSIAWWSVFKFTRLLVQETEAALLLFQISAFGWCLLPSLYLHFVLAFTHRSEAPTGSWLTRSLHGVGIVLALVAFVPDAMTTGILWRPWGSSHAAGPVYYVFGAYSIVLFALGLVLLVRARAKEASKSTRTQYGYVIVGALFPVLVGSATNIWLPIIGVYVLPLGEVLSTLNVALVGYAMARHGLLGVSLEQAAETIIATMGDALLVVDHEDHVVVANEAAAKLLECKRADVVGRPVHDFVSSDLPSGGGSQLASIDASESEGELLTNGGHPVPVILSTRQVRDAAGAAIGAVLVAKDIRQLRGAMLELSAANERLARQSITDELTGVSNRRHTNQRLEEEFELAKRYHRTFSVAVLDLDDFKRINDEFGHQAGDRVLEKVAAEIKGVLRDADVVSRWGGDEFFVILGETDAAKARDIGSRILSRIASAKIEGLDSPVRASLGIATFDPDEPVDEPSALVTQADEALYAAKRAGKGRLEAAGATS